MGLILASASPRRSAILQQIGIAHRVEISLVDESSVQGSAQDLSRTLAEVKAMEVSLRFAKEACLGYDTIVFLDNEPFGKPVSERDARRMLVSLRGKTHEVSTGFALCQNGDLICSGEERTKVRFVNFSEAELDDYIASGEPMDKAGSYGIQGRGARLVESVQGCFYNVVGLPVARTLELIARNREIINHVR